MVFIIQKEIQNKTEIVVINDFVCLFVFVSIVLDLSYSTNSTNQPVSDK